MFCISFVVVVVRSRLIGFDRRLEEAAKDLGATPLETFRLVTLPLIMPGIFAGAMLAFALSIDDFVISNFNSGTTVTFPLYIFGAFQRGGPGRGQLHRDDPLRDHGGGDGFHDLAAAAGRTAGGSAPRPARRRTVPTSLPKPPTVELRGRLASGRCGSRSAPGLRRWLRRACSGAGRPSRPPLWHDARRGLLRRRSSGRARGGRGGRRRRRRRGGWASSRRSRAREARVRPTMLLGADAVAGVAGGGEGAAAGQAGDGGRWVGEASIGPPQAWVRRAAARGRGSSRRGGRRSPRPPPRSTSERPPGPRAHRDPAAAPAEGDAAVRGGAEVVEQGAAVGDRARRRSSRSPRAASGTGSVRTMWEEATVSRPRSGPRRPLAAAPIASTARSARTRRRSVRASTPSAPSRAAHRRGLVDLDPVVAQPLARIPSARRAGCTVAALGADGAGAEGGRGAARLHLAGAERHDRLRARRARGRRPAPRSQAPSWAGAVDDLQVARRVGTRRRPPARRRRRRSGPPPPAAARAIASAARVAPALAHRGEREPHRVAEAAVAAARAAAADRFGLEQDDARLGLELRAGTRRSRAR